MLNYQRVWAMNVCIICVTAHNFLHDKWDAMGCNGSNVDGVKCCVSAGAGSEESDLDTFLPTWQGYMVIFRAR